MYFFILIKNAKCTRLKLRNSIMNYIRQYKFTEFITYDPTYGDTLPTCIMNYYFNSKKIHTH